MSQPLLLPSRMHRTVYVALSGADLLDVGLEVSSFVEALAACWETMHGDVAVWQQGCGSGEGSRLVAVLHPSPNLG